MSKGNLKTTDMGWEFYPKDCYFIRRMHNEYNDKIPIYVTENGMANNDQINFEEKLMIRIELNILNYILNNCFHVLIKRLN